MKPFGRNQWIGVAALIAPFSVITFALFTGKATASEWTAFCQWFVPLTLAGVTVPSAIHKRGSAPRE